MTQPDERPLDTPRIREVISKIEDRNVKIKDVEAWLRVLSVHPPSSGDMSDGVVLRLGLRPGKDTDAVVVNNKSLAARLYEVGISFPIDFSRDIARQVDDLILTVRQDAPRALELSEFPRVVVVPTPIRAVDLVAAVISLIFTVSAAWVYQVAVASTGRDLLGAVGPTARMAVFILVALIVYILTTARRLR